jgi:hypothetical protein
VKTTKVMRRWNELQGIPENRLPVVVVREDVPHEEAVGL